ncbi:MULTISPECIES: aminotransferase class V-fold PLP-dependent enzyme [Prochlorococcus]|uniref:aminotransferase class V-fold PLP-dependent enzyme n=1 Tax=Prochlorococcus TaxID=1218 RepID=UPI00053396E3|nr:MULTISPECIES: aminotransferase class V-fold PLP-dependent enzyme [Prochlorococcus]KGG12981.1 Cysteine desulfurase [Prochlorococcus sp. MIT 0601]
MPALANKSYFNYGGQGPLPEPSLNAIISSWEKIQELGPFTNQVWPYVTKEVELTRNKLANLCGVNKHQIALTENVTSGCILPIWGLPLSAGERILISDCEHPGVVSACKELARRKNLEIDILPVQTLRHGIDNQDKNTTELLRALDVALKEETRLVVLSHLLWNTGVIMPIVEVAEKLSSHACRPFLLVDAAQSFGQIPIQDAASKADIYAFTSHKWACGPEGLGGVAISQRVIENAHPTLVGWKSLKNEGSIYDHEANPFHADARRFEIATSCVPLLAGLRCSLELLEKEGDVMERLKRINQMSARLWEKLRAIDGIDLVLAGRPSTGLVSFSTATKYSSYELVKKLGDKGLWIRVLEDPEWLRACIHITTTAEEIDNLAESLKTLINRI